MQAPTKANSIGSLNYEYVRYTLVKDLQGNVIGLADKNGNLAAKYAYDAWGNTLSVTDGQGNDVSGNPDHIANVNPLRYRGYYFDQETGFYYLHTRYYDPMVGRFINADGYVTTDSGLSGANMFAYCKNNPVMLTDSTGELAIWAIVVGLLAVATIFSGCSTRTTNNSSSPRSDLVAAPDLNRSTASQDSYNCYGNAIGKQIRTNPSGYRRGDSTAKTYEAVKKDVGAKNIRRLNSANDSIKYNENLVALKCGPMDYHFMVRVNNVWYNKPGTTPLISNESLSIVTSDKWVGRYINSNGIFQSDPSIYYDDETIYFAIVKEWDSN